MTNDREPYRRLLLSIVEYAKEQAEELKARKCEGLSDQDVGRRMAIYSLLSNLRNDAPLLGVPLDQIGLAMYDPDTDLF